MFTDLQVINLGLGKIAASQISRIDPPVSSLEKFCANGYPHWKPSELAKRRWVFATAIDYVLPQVAYLEDTDQPYKYELPANCLRPIRVKRTEWIQRKRFIHSAYEGLKISYIEDVPASGFDPLFVEVLACRVALESVEYVTQSNTKKADAAQLYKMAVSEAAQNNAFVIGPEDIQDDDNVFPWLTARY